MVMPALPEQTIAQMFLGNCPGSIGEISALALIAGGCYLVYRRVISVRIPAAYLGTVAVLTLVFHKADAPIDWMLYSLLSSLSSMRTRLRRILATWLPVWLRSRLRTLLMPR